MLIQMVEMLKKADHETKALAKMMSSSEIVTLINALGYWFKRF